MILNLLTSDNLSELRDISKTFISFKNTKRKNSIQILSQSTRKLNKCWNEIQ